MNDRIVIIRMKPCITLIVAIACVNLAASACMGFLIRINPMEAYILLENYTLLVTNVIDEINVAFNNLTISNTSMLLIIKFKVIFFTNVKVFQIFHKPKD